MRYQFFSYIILLLVIVGCPSAMTTKEQPYTINNSRLIPLESKQTGQTHELVVILPESYHKNPAKKYPVLYFLDAYWDTTLLSATYGNLMYDEFIPEFIMVGMSYPAGANYEQERLRDFTPTTVVERSPASGGGEKFLRFIKESVVPKIESEFRGDKNQRALAGSSLGGLFTLYAMYDDPEFFDRYISISPAAGWDKRYLAKVDTAYARQHKELNARLLICVGTEEYKPFADGITALQQQIAKRHYKGLHLNNYEMKGMRHTSGKGECYVHGLMWVWKDITPVGPGGLERAYTAQ